jgi:hypothetical protein
VKDSESKFNYFLARPALVQGVEQRSSKVVAATLLIGHDIKQLVTSDKYSGVPWPIYCT